ncbi:site-specific integrase [Nonomuraea jabiensis]|uniref:hypothetical protein n=1 Tax=Nonomuraea jabiensis TaxID=882448 RepID=UPI0036C7EB1C
MATAIIIDAPHSSDLTTPIGQRDRLLLGLALMDRRSELVALTRDEVREAADGLG